MGETLKISPAKIKVVGDFLAYILKYLYLCTGFENCAILMKRLLLMTIIVTGIVMASCNVTRTITTQSQYYQRGDTTCTIVTKTIETYDASKK